MKSKKKTIYLKEKNYRFRNFCFENFMNKLRYIKNSTK
jgi:hypothetical protein